MLFYDSRDTEILKATRNKLFASNEKQIDNQTLTLDMLHSCMYVMYTYYCRGVFKKYFLVWMLFFVDLCSQKSYLRHWTSIFKAPSKVVRVEVHRMMFVRHFHLLQSYI